MNINIYRGSTVWVTIKTDDNTRLVSQLLGEDIIKSSFNSHIFLDIGIGDFIIYGGIIYHINSLPNIKKNSINSYDYDITFESESYELLKTQFLDSDGNSDFYLVGNLETFIDLIVYNMNRGHTGWVSLTRDQTNHDYKLLSFSKNNCMQVLQKLCVEFEGEFYFEFTLDCEEDIAKLPYLPAGDAVIGYKPAAEAEHGYKPVEFTIYSYTKDICFTDKAGSDSGLTFKYKQGLRNIHRTTLSEKNIITRLYAFGSRKNLKSDYRDYSRRLKFVSVGNSYLEKNIDKYGTIEHTEIFEDIYPHREGTISYVGEDITKFRDTNEPLMFDLNDYLLPGITAKVHFNSGDLGGYEFEISNYNHTTKEFTIIKFTDDQGYVMPNDTLKPKIGNKYVLIDIFLPQSYIDTAETLLQTKAQAYLDDNCDPRVTYILEPDWRYFKTHLIELKAGDFITIQDTVLGIDVMTRIVELTKSVANEYKYTLKLTDHLEVQLIQRIYSEQEDLKEKIEIGYGGDIIRSRRNWRTSEELRSMIYDTDGKFDMDNIRPLSVQTGMLSVGTKSTQFILREIEIEGNYQSDVSKFHASAGQLIHLSIADEIRTWTLSENTQNSLANETAYYIYAKCTKEPGYTGQTVVDDTQRKFDDDETYYYFLIGVLHSVVDGVRGVSLTYGQTIINGKFIRTGKIESTDGLTYFDLDNSEVRGNIKFSAEMYYTKTFRQATAPTEGMEKGDIWIDTSNGDKPYTYDGIADWISAYTIINGGNIETGSIVADRLNITNLADIANMVLGDTGYIRTAGKDSYESAVAGYWMGYDVDKHKLNIGNATNYLKWTGSALQVKGLVSLDALSAINVDCGTLTAGIIDGVLFKVGTEGNIYFKSSDVTMFDFANGLGVGYRGMALKYSTSRFFDINWKSGAGVAIRAILASGNQIGIAQVGTGGAIASAYGGHETGLQFYPNGADKLCTIYGTGTLQIPQLEIAPTAHIADLTYHIDGGVNPYFHGYIGPPDNTWGKITLTAPNW